MPNPMLVAEKLIVGYSKSKPLTGELSLTLCSGQMTCLLGPNGAGKSTLLRTLANLQPALSGSVSVCGRNVAEMSLPELSTKMSVVLTDKISAGGLTVFEIVSLGRQPYTGFFGRLSDADRLAVRKAISDVGISHKSSCYVAELSDGERQRVMIAKALAQQTPVIILDEPTAFLDAGAKIEILSLLHRLASEQGKSILLSTHDVDVALQLADNLWIMDKVDFHVGTVAEIVGGGFFDSLFGNQCVRFDAEQRRYLVDSRM